MTRAVDIPGRPAFFLKKREMEVDLGEEGGMGRLKGEDGGRAEEKITAHHCEGTASMLARAANWKLTF